MTVAVASGITVAGRTFRPVTSNSVERYNWLLGHLSDCGLAGAETRGEIMTRISAAGKTYGILAGSLTEVVDGVQAEWTGKQAAVHERWFARLTDLADIMALHPLLVEVAEGFFSAVAISSGAIATSSDSTSTTPESISAPTRSEPVSGTPSVNSALPCAGAPVTT